MIWFENAAAGPRTFYLDDVSVREVPTILSTDFGSSVSPFVPSGSPGQVTLSVESGRMKVAATHQWKNAYTSLTTVAGKNYRFRFKADLNGQGDIGAVVYDNPTSFSFIDLSYGANGTYTIDFTARSNTTLVWFQNNVASSRAFFIDHVSIEILEPQVNYTADVVSYSDYEPYGMQLQHRHAQERDYRYGFQGQERDDEIKGEGNSLNYEYRMHDPRIGRFFAVDPLAPKYPHNSPYAFSENMVIHMVELEGLEAKEYAYKNSHTGETEMHDTYYGQTGYGSVVNPGRSELDYDFSLELQYSISKDPSANDFGVTYDANGLPLQTSYADRDRQNQLDYAKTRAFSDALSTAVIGNFVGGVTAPFVLGSAILAAPTIGSTLGSVYWNASAAYGTAQGAAGTFLTEVAATKAGAWTLAGLELYSGYGWYSDNAVRGDLSNDIAKTFSGGRYQKMVLSQPITVSRYYDNIGAYAKGRFMTNPSTMTGVKFVDRMKLALKPEWNNMTKVAHWELPEGTTVYKGRAAMQFPWIGGGTQYFVPNLNNVNRVPKP